MEKGEMLKTATAEAIQEVMGYVRATTDFAIEQAPDLAQQLVAFRTVECWIGLAFSCLWLALGLGGAYILYRGFKIDNDKEDRSGNEIPCYIFGTIAAIFGLVFTAVSSYHSVIGLCKVYYAPKVYILEKLAALLQ